MQNTLSIRYAFCACARVFCAIYSPLLFSKRKQHAMLECYLEHIHISSANQKPEFKALIPKKYVLYNAIQDWIFFMVFNATSNNISAISWWSDLLVEETGGPGENSRPVASH